MKIALITHDVVRTDGQGKISYELARHVAAQGHEVHLYTNRVDPSLSNTSRITVHHVPALNATNFVRGIAFALMVWLLLRRRQYDVIHNSGDAAFIRSDVNTCYFCHSAMPVAQLVKSQSWLKAWYRRFYQGFHAVMERSAYRRSRVVIAISRTVADDLNNCAGVPKDKIAIVYPGVDSDEYSPVGDEAAETLKPEKPDRKALRLLFVGDLRSARKGLDTVLEALTTLPHQVTLGAAGRTSNSTYPHIVASTPSLTQRVHFLGFRTDTPTVYREHDVFVFPSHYDTFGLVVLEAMASGLPVIASAATGASELIEHGINGYVLQDPHDAATLSSYIEQLVDDEPLRRDMGRQARRTAVHHSWQHTARQVESLYESVRRSHAGRGSAFSSTSSTASVEAGQSAMHSICVDLDSVVVG